jgi:hypothetical protein
LCLAVLLPLLVLLLFLAAILLCLAVLLPPLLLCPLLLLLLLLLLFLLLLLLLPPLLLLFLGVLLLLHQLDARFSALRKARRRYRKHCHNGQDALHRNLHHEPGRREGAAAWNDNARSSPEFKQPR